MIELLPEGSPIGRLQASFQWVLAHTSRFRGLMTITMGEGEGFILIDRGKPVGCFFQLGGKILRGRAAYTHFMGLPIVDLSLRRYTSGELETAVRILKPPGKDATLPVREKPAAIADGKKIPAIVPEESTTAPTVPVEADYRERRENLREETKAPAAKEGAGYPVNGIVEPPEPSVEETAGPARDSGPEFPGGETGRSAGQEEPGDLLPDEETIPGGQPGDYAGGEEQAGEEEGQVYPEGESPGYPEGLDSETLGHLLMGRIISLPGVRAVSIFGRGRSLLSVGNTDLDSLVLSAEDILDAAKRISTVIPTGPLLHLILQVPAGNVIITPYFNEYLCIFTDPKVNLGQVRKILKEIPARPGTRRNGT